jgi:hypothetical protein
MIKMRKPTPAQPKDHEPMLFAACCESHWESHRKTKAIETDTAVGAARADLV